MASLCMMARDDNQQEVRENPKMQLGDTAILRDNNYPQFINKDANHIDFNGDNWSDLAAKFSHCDSLPVNILHIGDSHMQPGVSAFVVRNELYDYYGHSHGRGLISPCRLADTNQPEDYSISSPNYFEKRRLVKTPWPIAMGFTGIAIRPRMGQCQFSIKSPEVFDQITAFFTGNARVVNVSGKDSSVSSFRITNTTDNSVSVALDCEVSSVTVSLEIADNATSIHGFNLVRGNNGVSYHVIGNNGAQYAHYNMVDNFCQSASQLSPDLIIISLGTNEAFGRILDAKDIVSQMDKLIKNLKKHNPHAKLLLTTPAECQWRQRKHTRRGSSAFTINENVAKVRDIITKYARDNHIPLYDWYAVAGGNESSRKWLAMGLFNTDRVHLSVAGYQLYGKVFADALINALITGESSIKQ